MSAGADTQAPKVLPLNGGGEWHICPECSGEGHFPDGPGVVRCAECEGVGGWERAASERSAA